MKRATVFLILIVSPFGGPKSVGATPEGTFLVYDTSIPFRNPFLQVDPTCQKKIQFYQVSRPLISMLNHIFIGAVASLTCGNFEKSTIEIYGTPKGPIDRTFFMLQISLLNQAAPNNLNKSPALVFLGEAKNDSAFYAAQKATEISQGWDKSLTSSAYAGARILVTPLLGRPCAVAADEIKRALQPILLHSDRE